MKSSVVIVGVGPRGLGLLERLHAHCLSGSLPDDLVVHLVDPIGEGVGVHLADQPDYLLVNTVAGQITVFADHTVRGAGPVLFGPSLAQWANVDANAYLPRATLGRYLRFAYRYFLDLLSASIPVHEHRTRAVAVARRPGGGYRVELAQGAPLEADFLFLCTGHGRNRLDAPQAALVRWSEAAAARNPLVQYLPRCYPLAALEAIPSSARVAIRGMGLSANDVVAALSSGRGGVFFRTRHGQLRYAPSGREPVLMLFSRQSLPFGARARNQKGVGGQHQAVFLTRQAIDHARERRGAARLDFREDVLPLLVREMAWVMRAARGLETASLLASGPRPGEIEQVMALLDAPDAHAFADIDAYRAHLDAAMREDLRRAARGNLDDPHKAAADVIRDVRDNLRYAIEQGGLSAESYRDYLDNFMPVMNRLAVGPPMSRVEEWLALADAGVLQFCGGPGARLECDDAAGCFVVHTRFRERAHRAAADVLIDARIEAASLELDDSPLLGALRAGGLVRPFANGQVVPGGIDIDAHGHPLDAAGQPLERVWALGNPTEGANFYTYILPRPQVNSRFIHDAGRAVLEMFAAMCARQPARDAALSS
ncbi:FAD/NAD(P)-binding protein [Burkholderia plantarii]|uniref:FAD/NAD(P)-binding protein n=1 Tax=Burkholderia plantarii TaxID=41899 RepID=UPI002729F779|nr:FAD/NAD(P)-binding protein [Burkholderia plantarii]WLE59898.1 FAD/NAD(P)-binding protein [Burkholderia plantarii]